jgi:hypothetical protein
MEDKILIAIDLSVASELLIELLIEDAVDPSVFEEIAKVNTNRPQILKLLLENPDTPDELRRQISSALSVPVKQKTESGREHKPDEERTQNIFQKLQKLNVSEKILLALRGGKEIRTLLLRDSNKDVSLSVLENPKITETELEMIAKSRSISDEALRRITKKREWMKNYGIMHALVTNPKTPPGIALQLVGGLRTRDLGVLAKNRNVSEGLRGTAKKLVLSRKGI